MASTGGGKIRSKRSKVTNKPYARRTSFLGRVTETVTNFITPSWLSNAWQGVPEEEGDDVAPGHTNQGFMLPGFPAQATSGIPARNYQHQDALEQGGNPEGDNDEPDIILEEQHHQPSADVIMEEQQPSTSMGHRSHKTPYNRYAKPLSASTPNDDIMIIAEKKPVDRDDGASDTSVSTSGCSSLVPNIDLADHRAKLSKYNLDRLSEMARNPSDSKRFRSDSPRFRSDSPRPRSEVPLNTSTWSEMSATSGRSSPFGRRPSRPQQSAQSSRRPTFNSSYFCTPRGGSSLETSMTDSPGRASPFSSPFYPGKTTFGGSSAQRPVKRPRTSPYEVHLPVKRHVRIRPSSRNEVDVTSQTAKRILETLEKMSTPLSDAKKIPLSPTSSPFSFTPGRSSRVRQSGVPRPPGVQERVRIPGPPTQGLRIPQRVRIADNRQPPLPVSKREPKTEAKPETVSRPPEDTSPRLSSSPPSAGFSFKMTPSTSTTAPARTQESRVPPFGGESSRSGGKMRSSKREQHYKSPLKEEEEIQEIPDLPDVPLPLANGKTLPSFQFGAPTSASGSISKGTSQRIKPLMASTPSPFGTTSAGNGSGAFKFSSPIVKDSTKSSEDSAPAPAQSFFKFSAPKQAAASDAKNTPSGFGGSSLTKATPAFGGASAGPSTSSKESPIKIHEEEEEPSGGIKIAKELKTGSCLEVFGMSSKPNQDSSAKLQSSTSSSGSTKSSGTKPPSLADKFKPATGSWSCDQCMVRNNADVDKCTCCTAPKPGGSTAPSKPLFGQSSIGNPEQSASKTPVVNCGFGDKFKKPAGTWTCDTCSVPNDADKTKCVACQTPKPGAVNSSAVNKVPPPSAVSIGFGNKFKPDARSWKCDTCMLSNKSTVNRCVACETPKPGSQQTLSAPPASVYKFGNSSTTSSSGSFKFGAPSASNQNSSSIASGSTFKSGGSITSGTSAFKFGAPSTTSESKPDASAAPFKFGQSTDDSAKSSPLAAPSGEFNFANPKPSSSGGSLLNDKGGAPPNADPFKSGTFSAPKTTNPVADIATATNTATDSVVSAAKVTSAPSKSQFNFGAPAAASGTRTDSALSTTFSTGSGTTEQKSTFNFGGPKTEDKHSKSATTNPAFKFGGAATTTEQKDNASNKPAFKFGGADLSAASDATKTIFGGASQPSSQANTSEQSAAGKPLFNFKSNTTNTSFQFGSADSGTKAVAEPKPAQDENKPAFNFTAKATPGDSKPSFNFGGAGSKTKENKDAGSSNSLTKPGAFVFGANNTASGSSNQTTNTTPAASITPFKFGDTSAQNSGTFVFGGTPGASTNSQQQMPASSSGGAFQFAASAPATTQQATPAFGASSTTTNSVFGGFGSNASSANPSPVFGNPAPSTTSTSIPNFGTTASTPFGSQNQQQGAAAPAFGAANSGTPFGGSPAPAFGAGSGPTFGAGSAAPAFGNNATTTPAFGNATQQNAAFQPNATPAFQFGGNAQPAQQNSSSVFKFGASQNNNAGGTAAGQNSNASGAGGYNFSAQSAPSFNFSAQPSAPTASASPFQFNASGSNANSNPFQPMPTSSSTHSGRKIKRAVRRNMRK